MSNISSSSKSNNGKTYRQVRFRKENGSVSLDNNHGSSDDDNNNENATSSPHVGNKLQRKNNNNNNNNNNSRKTSFKTSKRNSQHPSDLQGNARFVNDTYNYRGQKRVVSRYITEDNTDYDPDDIEERRKLRQNGNNNNMYVDPYSETGYSTVENDPATEKAMRNDLLDIFSNVRGYDVDVNELMSASTKSTPWRTEFVSNRVNKSSSSSTTNDENDRDRDEDEDEYEDDTYSNSNEQWRIHIENIQIPSSIIEGIVLKGATGDGVPWGKPPIYLVQESKLLYTFSHSTIKEFEIEMDPRLFCHPDSPESYFPIGEWIKIITRLGLYYMGAELVDRKPSVSKYNLFKLVFSLDAPVESTSWTESELSNIMDSIDINGRRDKRKDKNWRPWNPLPAVTAADMRLGLYDPVRVFMHCVFATNSQSEITPATCKCKFVYYYYTN